MACRLLLRPPHFFVDLSVLAAVTPEAGGQACRVARPRSRTCLQRRRRSLSLALPLRPHVARWVRARRGRQAWPPRRASTPSSRTTRSAPRCCRLRVLTRPHVYDGMLRRSDARRDGETGTARRWAAVPAPSPALAEPRSVRARTIPTPRRSWSSRSPTARTSHIPVPARSREAGNGMGRSRAVQAPRPATLAHAGSQTGASAHARAAGCAQILSQSQARAE